MPREHHKRGGTGVGGGRWECRSQVLVAATSEQDVGPQVVPGAQRDLQVHPQQDTPGTGLL